jgi:hypothetical protein
MIKTTVIIETEQGKQVFEFDVADVYVETQYIGRSPSPITIRIDGFAKTTTIPTQPKQEVTP